jgi:hypothetical protein
MGAAGRSKALYQFLPIVNCEFVMHIHRSIDLIQSSGNIEILTNPSDSTAAGGPRQGFLYRYFKNLGGH